MQKLRILSCFLLIYLSGYTQATAQSAKKAVLSRERVRYEFIEEHLAPSILEKSLFDKNVRKLTCATAALVITFILVRLILIGVRYVPPLKKLFDYIEGLDRLARSCHKARNFVCHEIADRYLKERSARLDFFQRSDMKMPNLQPWRVPEPKEWPETEPLIKKISDKRDELIGKINSFWFTLFTILCPFVYKIVVYCADHYGKTYLPLLINYVEHWNEYQIGTPDKFRKDFELLHTLFVMRGGSLEIHEETAQFMVTSIVMQCMDERCDISS
jgi:hypothetical protein